MFCFRPDFLAQIVHAEAQMRLLTLAGTASALASTSDENVSASSSGSSLLTIPSMNDMVDLVAESTSGSPDSNYGSISLHSNRVCQVKYLHMSF